MSMRQRKNLREIQRDRERDRVCLCVRARICICFVSLAPYTHCSARICGAWEANLRCLYEQVLPASPASPEARERAATELQQSKSCLHHQRRLQRERESCNRAATEQVLPASPASLPQACYRWCLVTSQLKASYTRTLRPHTLTS